MLKKYSPAVKITAISLIASIGGFAAEIAGYSANVFTRLLLQAFESLNLRRPDQFIHFRTTSVNQFFYLLLLLGAVLYVISKHKESRLIRFVFLLILLSRVITTAMVILSWLTFSRQMVEWQGWFSEVYFLAIQVFWIYVSLWVLKYFNTAKEIEQTVYQYGEESVTDYHTASLWQRFFHLIIDYAVAILLLYWILEPSLRFKIIGPMLLTLQDLVGEKITLAIIVASFRLAYFLLGEGLVAVTPAKLLTETRVITEKGEQPLFAAVFGRSLYRFVPFEAFSFFGAMGWHDRWSDTRVAKEKRTGVDGGYYFFIIPAVIVISIVSSSIKQAYRERQYIKQVETENKNSAGELNDELKKIDTSSFIKLYEREQNWHEKYLKIEQIGTDSLHGIIVMPEPGKEASQRSLESAYRLNKNLLPVHSFTRAQLQAALKPPGTESPDKWLLFDGRYYGIEKIETFFRPNIVIAATNSYGSDFVFGLGNLGWATNLVSADVVDGNAKVNDILPMHVAAPSGYANSTVFYLDITTPDPKSVFKFNLTFVDTFGRKQVYQITGDGSGSIKRTIDELK